MKVFTIAWVNLRRVFRDRVGLFFILVFPFLIILAIGAVFGSGFTPVVGVVSGGGELATDLVERLEETDGIEVRTYEDRESVTTAVERGEAEGSLIVPDDYDERVRRGETVDLPFLSRPAGAGAQLALTVEAAIAGQSSTLRAAGLVESEGLAAFEDALARARQLAPALPRVEVAERVAGGAEPPGDFDFGAAQELVLFVFVISLSASSMLIESRRIGVSRRMLASPTSAGTILVGEGLGRFVIALFQGGLIYVVTLLLFGVDWGDPIAGIAIIVVFALVGTGGAMLMGASLHNAEQAGALGVFIGLGFAALGGSMVPIDLFPPAVATAAHATPHAWALDAFDAVLRDGAGLLDVLPELGVLAVYAAVLLLIGGFVFRRRLTAPAGAA